MVLYAQNLYFEILLTWHHTTLTNMCLHVRRALKYTRLKFFYFWINQMHKRQFMIFKDFHHSTTPFDLSGCDAVRVDVPSCSGC